MKKLSIEQIVLKSYDDIYKTARSVTKSSKTDLIPLITIRYIIDKIDLEGSGNIELEKFIAVYRNTLETLYTTCETTAHNLATKHVSMFFFKSCIDALKEAFSESVKK